MAKTPLPPGSPKTEEEAASSTPSARPEDLLDLGNVMDSSGDTARGWAESVTEDDGGFDAAPDNHGQGWAEMIAPDLVDDPELEEDDSTLESHYWDDMNDD